MFIAALFTAARTWKQPRHSSTDEWMKMWYVYRASLVAQLIKNPPATHETLVQFWGQEEPSPERDRLPTPVFMGFPGGSDSKESACNVGLLGFIPGLGRSPGKGNGKPLQYSCLQNSMVRGTWWPTVHGVTRVGHDLVTKSPYMYNL